jgi:hypothetical protein
MSLYVHIFGRGFGFALGSWDSFTMQRVYVQLTWLRRMVVKRQWMLAGTHDGGLEFSVRHEGHRQGWRLRGPVEHFEY